MKGLIRFFENLFFPPRCVSCREFLQKNLLDRCDKPLCDKCRLAWEREKGENCADCGLELLNCHCVPQSLNDAGVAETIKLISYRKDRETAGKRSVLYMKKHLNRRAFDFFAEQLSYPVKMYMDKNAFENDEVIFCYVPRGEKNVGIYGFDQSERLCRRLAEHCGAQTRHLFYRTRKRDAEQKKLSAKERAQNAAGHFALDDKQVDEALSKARCVFIVDDVITTGASLCGCAKPLRSCYAGKIVGVALAKTSLGRKTGIHKF